MNSFIQKLKRQSKIKKLKLENKELKKILKKQIEHNIKVLRHNENMKARMNEINELHKVNVIEVEYVENIMKKLLLSVGSQYSYIEKSERAIVKNANKIQEIIDEINSKPDKYG